jgi:hypothetical protein
MLEGTLQQQFAPATHPEEDNTMHHCVFIPAVLGIMLGLGLVAASAAPHASGKPAAPLSSILYSQMDGLSNLSTASNDAYYSSVLDTATADDFVVPDRVTWYIDQVEVLGEYDPYPQATSVNVRFFANAGGLPASGPSLAEQTFLVPSTGLDWGAFVIPLRVPVGLITGHYWLSVQAVNTSGGIWKWRNRGLQSYAPAAWRNPGGYYSTQCLDWRRRLVDCGLGGNDPDQAFQLRGVSSTHPPTATPIPTATPGVPQPSASPTPAPALPTPTIGPGCLFADVCPGDYFFTPVQYLANRGAISGYSDQTFRPGANTTRGQLCKIIVAAEGWTIDTTDGPHFPDVPPDHPFYNYVETAYKHHIIAGYADSLFRPNADVTRGQLSKIIVGAEGWDLTVPGATQTFADVPASNPFYYHIEAAYRHNIISGYTCGGAGEPCDGAHRPYFRPTNSATRGQIAKIVYGAVISPVR